MISDETIRLILQVTGSTDINDLSDKLTVLKQKSEDVAGAHSKFGDVMTENRMRILNLGRAAQDLAQGGFAGILNNIEGIVGGGGLAAGVLTAIGTAAYLAAPYVKEWVKSLGEGGEKFKPLTEGLDKFTEAIAKNKKEITELKEKNELNYAELLKYHKLVNETRDAEEKLATERAMRLVKAGTDKASQARAAAVKETIAETYGSTENLLRDLMEDPEAAMLGADRVEDIVKGAQEGRDIDVGSLKNISPKFAQRYDPFSPERKAQVKIEQDRLKQEEAFGKGRMGELSKRDRAIDRAVQEEMEGAGVGVSPDKAAAEARRMEREFARAIEHQKSVERSKPQQNLMPINPFGDEQKARAVILHNQQITTQIMAEDHAALQAAREINRQLQRQRTQQMNGIN
jgi:hypothetical protein